MLRLFDAMQLHQPDLVSLTDEPYRESHVRTTARITAFSPGQSPPPVRIPTRMPLSSSLGAPTARLWRPIFGYHNRSLSNQTAVGRGPRAAS